MGDAFCSGVGVKRIMDIDSTYHDVRIMETYVPSTHVTGACWQHLDPLTVR